MEEPVTLFVSEMSITMYSCKKNCEYCEKTYDKYSKFLVVTCCGEPKRFCLGVKWGHGPFHVKNAMRKEGVKKIIFIFAEQQKEECMLVTTSTFF